jgi:hypothetical protein
VGIRSAIDIFAEGSSSCGSVAGTAETLDEGGDALAFEAPRKSQGSSPSFSATSRLRR